MKVGKYELTALGSPAEHDGRLSVTIETELTLAQMVKQYNSGDITWGNSTGEELRYNQGIEALELDKGNGRAVITWRVARLEPSAEDELRQRLADLAGKLETAGEQLQEVSDGSSENAAAIEDLTLAVLELADLVGGAAIGGTVEDAEEEDDGNG